MNKLQTIFQNLISPYSQESKYWREIEEAYSSKGRFYHDLSHIENLYTALEPLKSEIDNWDAVLFCLFYHDIVYNPEKNDNETQSAILAEMRMREIGVEVTTINLTKRMILATAGHQISEVPDINIFTDADLIILGSDKETYDKYANAIRKEYAIYPDFLYKIGRKKVLQHFLSLSSIYKTNFFKTRYESNAKNNLHRELKSL